MTGLHLQRVSGDHYSMDAGRPIEERLLSESANSTSRPVRAIRGAKFSIRKQTPAMRVDGPGLK